MDYLKWIRSKVGRHKIFLNFAGGCITNHQGEILLQRRSDRNALGFPGGAMELGESAKETAIREVKEEIGLDVKIKDLVGIYTKYHDQYPSGDKAQSILIFFDFE